MRNKLITVLVVLCAVAFAYGYADAAINAACSGCHTMHNSQNGAVLPDNAAGPNERLLKATCVACHSGASGQKNGDTPIVLHTTPPTGLGNGKTNSGGDFYWVANGSDNKGHNVAGVASADVAIGATPPGWDQTATTGLTFDSKTLQVTGGAGWTGQLTCAGTFGCHGTRNLTDFGGIQGAHHNNLNSTATKANATNTTNVGSSYRFLAGIYGLEDENWNWNESDSLHNEYYGANKTDSRIYNGSGGNAYADTHTISFLCAECHGQWHSKAANDNAYAYGDPWRRHPTDIALPTSGEFAKYNTSDGSAIGKYSLEAPVARTTVPDSSGSTVTAGTDVVMCLSCHRAHGSNQPDLLRWDYLTMIAGGSNSGGCFTCHTEKNADGVNP